MWRFEALGTSWEIEADFPLAPALQRSVAGLIESFEAAFSRFRSDSLVSTMARASEGGEFAFPEGSEDVFALYDRLHAATGGAVDPLVGRDLERLGYDRHYSLVPRADGEPSGPRPVWSRDVVRQGACLRTRRAVLVDVGAAAKGFLVDRVAALLASAGVRRFLVDGSGDMRHAGPGPVAVGLEHPFDPAMAVGIVPLRNGALCASAVNRRAWGNGLHHVLDGRTGRPTRDVIATWALADDALTADGLATALFFTSGEDLARRWKFSFVRMFAGGHLEASTNFPGELFTEAGSMR